jgi:hypothetical protein
MVRRAPSLLAIFVAVTTLVLAPQSAQFNDAKPEATPQREVGLLMTSDEAYDGYTIYTPLLGHTVYCL